MTRIYAWLIDEHQMSDVSYQVVRAYVALRRPQIRVEHGREPVNAFIVQSHLPGMEAEVDFGEVAIRAPRRAGDLSPVLPAHVVFGQRRAPGASMRELGAGWDT